MGTIIEGIKFYTIQETAKVLQVTPQTIRSYIKPVSYTHLTLPTSDLV